MAHLRGAQPRRETQHVRVAQQLDVEVRGEITEYDVKVLELAALKGVFTDIVEDQVSYVNAPLLAAERDEYRDLLERTETVAAQGRRRRAEARLRAVPRGARADLRDR